MKYLNRHIFPIMCSLIALCAENAQELCRQIPSRFLTVNIIVWVPGQSVIYISTCYFSFL